MIFHAFLKNNISENGIKASLVSNKNLGLLCYFQHTILCVLLIKWFVASSFPAKKGAKRAPFNVLSRSQRYAVRKHLSPKRSGRLDVKANEGPSPFSERREREGSCLGAGGELARRDVANSVAYPIRYSVPSYDQTEETNQEPSLVVDPVPWRRCSCSTCSGGHPLRPGRRHRCRRRLPWRGGAAGAFAVRGYGRTHVASFFLRLWKHPILRVWKYPMFYVFRNSTVFYELRNRSFCNWTHSFRCFLRHLNERRVSISSWPLLILTTRTLCY